MLLITSMMLISTILFAQTTFYVRADGDDSNDGTSWANAKQSIAAMVSAIADPSNSQIFVKKGVYTLASTIQLEGANSGLKIYGGFAGNETCLCDRVFGSSSADSTVLSGNNSVRVIYNKGTSADKITGVVWDGFTIINGKAGGGAGMFNTYADLTVNNCIFKGNVSSNNSAGGMYNSYNNVIVSNTKFYGNTAEKNGGGGMLASTGSSATISNCVFDSNNTNNGSGAGLSTYTDAANPTTVTVSNTIFTRNNATGNGGGIYNYKDVNVTISYCTFTGNTSTGYGAGIHNNTSATVAITNSTFSENIANSNGGGVYNSASANGTISNCTFISNEAKNASGGNGGGAMLIIDSNPQIVSCSFLGNKAVNSGGALILSNVLTAKLVNCLFVGNKANNAGGAAYINNGTGKTCSPTFINCTIAGNNATTTGGGIYNTGAAGSNGTNTVITNTIIYGNNSGITNSSAAGATATVNYSNVQFAGIANEMDCTLSGTGNINADPVFIDATKTFSDAPFTEGDYALGSGSASVVNKGQNSAITGYAVDIISNTRVYDGQVDMGAYEFQGTLPVTVSTFTASLVNNRIQLKWSVGTETNVSRYVIERSQNGTEFEKIATVLANGSSSYSAKDNNPKQGINYYRLISIDNDGTTTSHKDIQSVKVASLTTQSVQISSNPVKGNVIKLALNGYANGDYVYKLVNMAGVTVQQGNVNYAGSRVGITTTVPAGVYMLYLSKDNIVIKTKLVKE